MTIHKTYQSNLSKEILYEAWISDNMVIAPVVKLEIDARIGGVYKLFAESPDGIFIMPGAFVEVVPNSKLVYSWQWEGTEEETLVEVNFKENAEGSVVELTHSGFLSQESFDSHSAGWDSHFKGLIAKIQNQLG